MRGPGLAAIVGYHLGRYAGVKRDMEVIRDVVRHIEDRTDLYPRAVRLEGRDELIVQAHVAMLWDAGMLKGTQSHEIGSPIPSIMVTDLSWEGHEFAAAVATDSGWERLKAKFTPAQLAGLSLKGMVDVANALALAWAKERLGLGE